MFTHPHRIGQLAQENHRERGRNGMGVFDVERPDPVLAPGHPGVPHGDVVALRGAFQDVSALYQTQVALAATRDRLADSEQRAAEEHELAAAAVPAGPDADSHTARILANTASGTGDDACLLAVRIL
jgi:hypothetical protein